MGTCTPTKRLILARGFTLLELTVCMAILLVAALAVSPSLVGAQRNWQNVYDSVPASLARDGRAARIVLQRVARRASLQTVTVGPDLHWIDLPYYGSANSPQVDRYARLYWSNGKLCLQEGQIDEHGARHTLTDTVVCANASDCMFMLRGKSVRMKITLSQGTTQMTVAAGVLTNNK